MIGMHSAEPGEEYGPDDRKYIYTVYPVTGERTGFLTVGEIIAPNELVARMVYKNTIGRLNSAGKQITILKCIAGTRLSKLVPNQLLRQYQTINWPVMLREIHMNEFAQIGLQVTKGVREGSESPLNTVGLVHRETKEVTE